MRDSRAVGSEIDAENQNEDQVDQGADDSRDNPQRLRCCGRARTLEIGDRLLLRVVELRLRDAEGLERGKELRFESLELELIFWEVVLGQ